MHRRRALFNLGIALAITFGRAPEANAAPIAPPETRLEAGFIQYGAALTGELLASPGAICPSTASYPCVIGSGGGLTLRGGYRFHAPFYLGAAYEFSKQDAHKAIYLAILQQARGEARYYLPLHGLWVPYLTGGLGVVAYGSQWSFETMGAMAFVGAGIELQFSRTSALAIALTYRPVLLTTWQDSSRLDRPTGVLSLIGVELSLEQRQSVYEAPSE